MLQVRSTRWVAPAHDSAVHAATFLSHQFPTRRCMDVPRIVVQEDFAGRTEKAQLEYVRSSPAWRVWRFIAPPIRKFAGLPKLFTSSGGFVKVYFDEALMWVRVKEQIASALLSSHFIGRQEQMQGSLEVSASTLSRICRQEDHHCSSWLRSQPRVIPNDPE